MQANALTGLIVRHKKTNALRIWSNDPEFIDAVFRDYDNVFARKFMNELPSSHITLKCKHVEACYRPPRYECVAVLAFKL